MMNHNKDIKNVILYTDSFDSAKANNEVDMWRASVAANIDCARFIEETIEAEYDYPRLSADCAKKVISVFGFNRVKYILKYNMQHFPKDDPRCSKENKRWGEDLSVPEQNERTEYLIKSHPILLNAFVNQTKREWEALHLWKEQDCVPLEGFDLQKRLLVLKPELLRDEHKNPDDQLIYVLEEDSEILKQMFASSKVLNGVYGVFVEAGLSLLFKRSDFIGILKDEHIPNFAREKYDIKASV